MIMRADVKCYYCGFVSGQLEGDPESARPWVSLRLRADVGPSSQTSRRVRCARCGGPVFLDEIETIRHARQVKQPAYAGAAR